MGRRGWGGGEGGAGGREVGRARKEKSEGIGEVRREG